MPVDASKFVDSAKSMSAWHCTGSSAPPVALVLHSAAGVSTVGSETGQVNEEHPPV